MTVIQQTVPWCPVPTGANPDALALRLPELTLENGETIPEPIVTFQTWGRLSPSGDNAVLVEHALTGDSHVAGSPGPGQPTAGWWPGLIGPGDPLDTRDLFVVAVNVLGGCRGTTGPASIAPDGRPWGSRFPRITVRDQVAVEAAVADALGIGSWLMVLGGSMGGMRAIEWAAGHPGRTDCALVIASSAVASADQVAWGHAQSLAITGDPAYQEGDYYGTGSAPTEGLALARRIAHLTYRCAEELGDRFGTRAQPGEDPAAGGRFAVQSYLDHHGAKLVSRFDAGSYLHLTAAMATHDVTRDRGTLAEVLGAYPGLLRVAAVDSDRLFPPELSEQIVAAHGHGRVHLMHSDHGHDGFLVETEQVAAVVRRTVADLRPRRLVRAAG